MSRPLRIEYPGAWYHVMNRGRRSEKIFVKNQDYRVFIDLLIEASELWNVNVSAYSLMPNHYHLLINTPEGNLSRFMRHINGVYTQRFNKNNKCEGQLFKGRYKSILVEGDTYLLQLVKYIHRNALRAKIVKNVDEFKWSSHIGYLSNTRDWNWLYKGFILSIFSEDPSEAVQDYLKYILKKDDRDLIKILESKKWPAMWGDDEFVFSVKEKYYKNKLDKEIPESYILSPEIRRIKDVVGKYYGVGDEVLCQSIRGTFNEPRNVAIYLARQFRNDSLEEIGNEFSLNRYSSVSTALRRMKKILKKDQKMNNRVKEMEELIGKGQP